MILTLPDALARLGRETAQPFAELFRHGTLSVEIFAPRAVDTQKPHAQDEVYIVLEGSGDFVHHEERRRAGRGDLIFVPAGDPHRFENFSADFTLWVVFHGPAGGERP
jgi:mannose-6-phosphate isomerase-like protein (cupin superfamily)